MGSQRQSSFGHRTVSVTLNYNASSAFLAEYPGVKHSRDLLDGGHLSGLYAVILVKMRIFY